MRLKQKIFLLSSLFVILGMVVPKAAVKAQLVVVVARNITFPAVGKVSYSDDFGAPRSGGRTHEGVDVIGKKLMPLVAAVDGTVSFINYPEATWGYAVGIRDKDGYDYWYLHVNNDTPGTDDGLGDGFFAYAPDIQPGNPVVKGQLIGYMGDSGDAESTVSHLHFEIHDPSGTPLDPYQSLKQATPIAAPVVDYPALPGEVLPYGSFPGGANIASGNFDADSPLEMLTGAQAGGGPLVKVLKKDGTVISSFYAYDPAFRGGVDVAAADLDGDGKPEIITAPGFGGGPDIRVFKTDGTLFKEFMAYDPAFHGGVSITAADTDGDGKAEIITGPGKGGGPDVRIFSSLGILTKEFMAYDPAFHGGIDVSALSKTASQTSAIVTAPQFGGGPDIKMFDNTGLMLKDFMAYDPAFHGGVRVSIGIVSSISQLPQIITMPASGGGPNLKTFNFDGTQNISTNAAFESWWRGGYDVAAADGYILIASGPGRRATVRVYNPNQFSPINGNGNGSRNNNGNGFQRSPSNPFNNNGG